MTTDKRKVQLGFEVNAEGAKKGFDEIKAGARDMASTVAQAGQQAGKGVDDIGNGAEPAAQKLDRATKNIINSIQRITAESEAGSRGTREFFESLARQRGVDVNVLKPYLDELEAVSKKHRQAGISAAQMSAALRGVPAQFTDIVTALASGQQPITVLLQQGGQLKDMFGGVGNAARAIGGYVGGLINPFTLAAGAAAALAYGYAAGSKESQEFAKSLILTGGAIDATAGRLSAMSELVSSATGATKGAAADAINQVVASGKVAADNMQLVSAAAVAMEKATGKAVADTVKQFEDLGRSPVSASVKLNEQYNYLTASIYAQIKALEDQGKAEEAAALAQKTFADAIKQRAGEIKNNLGVIEAVWYGIGDAISYAVDQLKEVGREQTEYERWIARIADLEIKAAPGRGIFSGLSADEKSELANLKQRVAEEDKRAKSIADGAAKEKERVKWLQDGEKYLTKQQQLTREIARIREQGKAAGMSESEINLRIAQARSETDKGLTAANSEALISAAKGNAKRYSEYYKQELDAFRISTEDYINTLAALERRALEAERNAVAKERPTDGAGRIKQSGRLADLDAQIADVSMRQQQALEDAAAKSNEVLAKMAAAAGKTLDPLEQAGRDFVERWGKDMQRAAIDGNEAILAAGRGVWESMSNDAQFRQAKQKFDTLFSDLEYQIESVKTAAARDGGVLAGLDAAAKADEIRTRLMPALEEAQREMEQFSGNSVVNEKTVTDAKRNLVRITTAGSEAFDRFTDDIRRSLTDAIYRGLEDGQPAGEVFLKTLQRTLKSAPIKFAVEASVDLLISSAKGLLSSSGAGAGGSSGGLSGGGLLSTASSLSNLSATPFGNALSKLATSGFGESVGLSIRGFDEFGSTVHTLSDAGSALNSAAGFLDSYGGYLSAAFQLSQGNVGGAIGAAVGQYFGGPIGAMIGSTILGGLFGGGGEDPHNNADTASTTFGIRRGGIYGLGAVPENGAGPAVVPYYTYMGQTSGSGRWGDSYAFSQDQVQLLNQQIDGIYAGFIKLAQQLGVSSSAVENFAMNASVSVSASEGVTGATTKALQALSDSLAQVVLPNIKTFQQSGETLGQTLARLVTNMSAVDNWGGKLGFSLTGFEQKNALVAKFGSADVLNSALSAYYQNFYSEQERQAKAYEELQQTFQKLNLTMPGSKEAFRALVGSLDLSTDAGRSTYASLMALAPAFAAVSESTVGLIASSETIARQMSGLKEQLESMFGESTLARARQLAELDPTNRALQQKIWAIQDARTATDAALSAVERAVNAQIRIAQSGAQVAQEQVDTLKSVFDTLDSNIKSLYGTAGADSAAGMAFIDNAIAAIGTSGYLPDAASLSEAIAAVRSGLDNKVYASTADQERERLLLANKLEILKQATGSQITVAEQQLQAAQAQVTALENTLTAAQEQINVLRGVDTSVKTVAQAIAQMNASLLTEMQASNAGRAVLGLAATTYTELPQFAVGTNYVPYDMVARIHTGERIVPAADNRELMSYLSGAGNEALLAEIKGLREEVKRLQSLTSEGNRIQQRTAAAVNGSPESPMLVEIAQ